MDRNRYLRNTYYKRSVHIIITAFCFFSINIFAQLPKPDHIVIVIEENRGYDQIINNSAAPYINSLAADNYTALFNDAHGVVHPSQPNYLFLFSGSNQGITNDNTPPVLPFTTQNLGAELLGKGLTFKGYSEDLPSAGFTGASSGQYRRKHNPWVNWQDASTNGVPSSLNVPFTDFPADFNSLPTVAIVVPNLDNDMHDGTIAAGDTWLKNHLDGYIQWAKTHNSLFILTFDEDDFTAANRIVTLITGQMVKKGIYAQTINHINVIRTIEEMYGLNYAGASKDSSAIKDSWITTTGIRGGGDTKVNDYKLFQNYPNPFNSSTNIGFSVPSGRDLTQSGQISSASGGGFVSLKIYDVLGREVATLVNEVMLAGNHTVTFNAGNLVSGIYYYKMQVTFSSGTGTFFSNTKKLVLLK